MICAVNQVSPEDAYEPYHGERLGLPQDGPGSLATMGWRFLALFLDWAACSAISYAIVGSDHWSAVGGWVTLAIYVLEQTLLVGTVGFSLGHRVFGMRVVREDGTTYVGFGRAFVRSVLVALVIPAVIWDADGRGFHDRAARTILISTR